MVKNLHETYTMQRLFLNSSPKIEAIESEWPILLFKDVIYWHFEKLMSLNISELETMFLQREGKIWNLARQAKFTGLKSIPDDENDKHEQCLQIIGDYFKETVLSTFLLHMSKEEEIQLKINSPCIVRINLDLSREYRIFFENKELVHLRSELFLEALKITMALYYNFNVSYPKEISNTLEFIQRYMLKINPDQGSKSNKKNNYKIVSLINKLKNVPTPSQNSLLNKRLYSELKAVVCLEIENTYNKLEHKKNKRALVSVLGKAIKFVTGNLDEDDLISINKNLEKLYNNQKSSIEKINTLTSFANHLTQRYSKDLEDISQNINETQNLLNSTINTLDSRTLLQTEIYQGISLLEQLKLIERTISLAFKDITKLEIITFKELLAIEKHLMRRGIERDDREKDRGRIT
ncbi:hypothetical protein FQR65_LT16903 [Abscondita terminalis]|nr:hypothetical protein FQR65_LT16903 [Abscondita terminalis]